MYACVSCSTAIGRARSSRSAFTFIARISRATSFKMRELCDELDSCSIRSSPLHAGREGGESVDAALRGGPGSHERLVISPAKPRRFTDDGVSVEDCQYRKNRRRSISTAVSRLCCAVYDQDKIIADDIPDDRFGGVDGAQIPPAVLRTCMARNLHLVYTGVRRRVSKRRRYGFSARFIASSRSRTQDRPSGLRRARRRASAEGRGLWIWLEALRLGRRGSGRPEKYFNALIDGRAGIRRGFSRLRGSPNARRRKSAPVADGGSVRLWPTHDIYVSELRRMAELVGSAPEHGLA